MKARTAIWMAAACWLGFSGLGVSENKAWADGCYLCGSGSSEACKNYCRYHGEDTFAARKECEKRGCKVSGTGSCPTAVNYKVCMAPAEKTDTTVAAIPWCAPGKTS